jgi:hypothetical protein
MEQVECFARAYRRQVELTLRELNVLPSVIAALRLVDALWIDERHAIDHRRELRLAQKLCDWLKQHENALVKAFN